MEKEYTVFIFPYHTQCPFCIHSMGSLFCSEECSVSINLPVPDSVPLEAFVFLCLYDIIFEKEILEKSF